MNDTTISPAERIRAFAGAVRAELADLPEDDVDDLTGGLVADLTEQAEDSGGDVDFGDPIAYAHELRSAAGLPEKSDATAKTPLPQRVSAWWGGVVTGIRSSRFGAWLLDLLTPVWWVLRGIGLYAAVLFALSVFRASEELWPRSPLTWSTLGALVLVSVQWGRGRWLPASAWQRVRTAATVIGVLALPWVLGALLPVMLGNYNPYASFSTDSGYSPPDGLLLDGTQVGNLFVYDRNGELVDGAQIYTGRGTPLNLYGSQSEEMSEGWDDDGDGAVTLPMLDLQDRPIWNVYPLQEGMLEWDGNGEPDLSNAETPKPPFARAPQRDEAPETPATPSPADTPVPSPTAEPTP